MDPEVVEALLVAFQERTGPSLDSGTAKGYLEATGYDVEAAFNLWIDCGGVVSGGASASMNNTSPSGIIHHIEQLDDRTWKIVEDEGHGQFPFIYVIKTKTKMVVIDTGCGHGNIKQFITDHINVENLPYLVICTHVHFDHVGGNHWFSESVDCEGIMMGGQDPQFSKNYGLVALSPSSCCNVKDFKVNRWLYEGDVLEFENPDGSDATIRLRIIQTPGHTLDSISILDEHSNRLFIGDLLYPFTTIGLSAVGSSPAAYLSSIEKLKSLATEDQQKNTNPSAQLKLSCGHVEANLVPALVALTKVHESISLIRAGGIPPRRIEDGVGEYDTGEYAFNIPLNAKWE